MRDHRLPPEIVEVIFLHSLPRTKFIRPVLGHPPFILVQVNASWRAIALSMPRLWSALDIDNPQRSRPTKNILAVVDMWLGRAGSCPLSLFIRNTVPKKAVSHIFKIYSERVKHLQMEISFYNPPFAILKYHTPLLEVFELRSPLKLDDRCIMQLSATLQSAPRLRHVYWDNIDERSLPLELNWSQLTRLSLNTNISMQECLDILEESRNLIDAEFSSILFPSANLQRPPILLPQLDSLIISTDKELGPAFDTLILPGLRILALIMRSGTSHIWPQSAFRSFIDRSGCSLQSLNLYDTTMSEPEFIECLRLAQASLTELTFQIDDKGTAVISDEVLDLLTQKDEQGTTVTCLCPRLEVLALYNCIQSSKGKLADMIQSRWRHSQTTGITNPRDPLYVARLAVFETFERESLEIESLRDLRKQGLILGIYSDENGNLIDLELEELELLNTQHEEKGRVVRLYNTSPSWL